MSEDASILIEGLGKRYRFGASSVERSLVDTIGGWIDSRRARVRGVARPSEFWALRDVSFSVPQGQTLGVIGHNGAGKSTLLKLLSRITAPTEGSIRYRGRVGSLLEVGAGFHPELSGRDNIFLSGAVLGMRERQIREKLDEIVEFSEVGPFLETPVKRYSSGMYLRLAFAVAAHLETDILLLDEVLAVGDAAFQKKCLDRMEGVARQGRTILFVSHNLTAVRSLCDRAILLDHGGVALDGDVGKVIDRYSQISHGAQHLGRRKIWTEPPANSAIQMVSASVRPPLGTADEPVFTDTGFVVEWDFVNAFGRDLVTASMQLHDERGLLLFDEGSWDTPEPLAPGRHRTCCALPANLLNEGTYFVSLKFQCRGELLLELPNVLQIELLDGVEGRHGWFGKWEGLLRVRLDWKTEALPGLPAAEAQSPQRQIHP